MLSTFIYPYWFKRRCTIYYSTSKTSSRYYLSFDKLSSNNLTCRLKSASVVAWVLAEPSVLPLPGNLWLSSAGCKGRFDKLEYLRCKMFNELAKELKIHIDNWFHKNIFVNAHTLDNINSQCVREQTWSVDPFRGIHDKRFLHVSPALKDLEMTIKIIFHL